MSGRGSDRFLTTVLMTDMVGSTELAAELGDQGWRELVQLHNALVRDALRRHDGREMDTAGDGFFAIFDAPGAAILCALEIVAGVRDLGVEVRAGIHVGEVEQIGRKVGGITVPIASRISAIAGAGEVLVSATVHDLAAGAGLNHADRGTHELKGVPGEWRLYAVTARGADATATAPSDAVAAERRNAAVRRSRARPIWQRHPRASLVSLAGLAAVLATIALLAWSPWRPPALASVMADAVGIIDPERNQIVGQVDVGQQPAALAHDETGFWVASTVDGTVQRIDAERQIVVHTVDVGLAPVDLVVANGSVWVANSGERSVSRINVDTGRVVDTIEVGTSPSGVAAGAGGIWVTNRGDGTLTRLDPATGSAVTTTPVGIAPSDVAVADDGVWITSEDGGTLVHLDPQTGVALAPPIPVGARPIAVAIGAGSVWVASATDGTVTRVDPQGNRVTGVAELGGALVALVANDDHVWAGSLDGSVHRLDPAALDAPAVRIAAGSGVSALASTPDGLWFTAVAQLESHRGGSMRVAFSSEMGTEPLFFPNDMQLWSLVADGLVAYPRLGGASGSRLVPGLAASMPTVSDGGLTLTFRLRPGLVYSDGRAVAPEDFRNAVERRYQVEHPIFGGGLDPFFPYGLIRGAAEACPELDLPVARCDLSEGIVTDAAAGTITFHLSEADPFFLVTLTTVYPIPAEAATANSMTEEPFVGTGPYMIVDFSDAGLRLVRNPHFETWSQRDRPDGFVDEIIVTVVPDPAEATSLVERGEADHLVGAILDAGRIPELRVQYPAQLHFSPTVTTTVFMDTSRPPFDSLEARQAVNLALDRAALAEMRGGAFAAAPTCQLVPPTFPGYQPYCPWTVDPDAGGQWTGADLEEAQRLVDRSGTRGEHFVLGPVSLRFNAEVGPYVAEVLNELGYVVTFEAAETPEEFVRALDEGRVQVGIFSLLSGSASAADFLVDCTSGVGVTNYCDEELDASIDRAVNLEVTDPAAAAEAWAEIDREITDLALFAPLMNEGTIFVSARVRNVQDHLVWGMLIDQAWVEEPAADTGS